MMATRDCTAPSAITSAARIAGLNGRSVAGNFIADLPPSALPTTRKTTTGVSSVPMKPIGSRAKIFASTHVSFQKPRRKVARIRSVPDAVASELEEDVLERRYLGAEAADVNSFARDVM